MSNLKQEEKELILDFYFRCGDEDNITRARDMIASKPEAAKLYAGLEETLTQLDSIKYEPCPDNIVELTVARLKLAASKGAPKLHNLLEKEQKKTFVREKQSVTVHPHHWRNIIEVAAIAAVILIITGLGFPMLSNVRQKSWQTACQAKLGKVGQGLVNYAYDNRDTLPSVATSAGSPWWKVGDQGSKNHSNTRHLWLLVKENYVDAENFTCPGHKKATPVRFDTASLHQYNDFPSRNNLSFSFRTKCNKTLEKMRSVTIIMADRNPVFANIPQGNEYFKFNEFTKIFVSEELKRAMSPNHNSKGQNLLNCDGSARFSPNRVVDGDDIFMIEGVDQYSGCEVPRDDHDIFLAP
jgi:hypothetical protein